MYCIFSFDPASLYKRLQQTQSTVKAKSNSRNVRMVSDLLFFHGTMKTRTKTAPSRKALVCLFIHPLCSLRGKLCALSLIFNRLSQNYELIQGVCVPRCVLYTQYLDFCKKRMFSPTGAATFGKVQNDSLRS